MSFARLAPAAGAVLLSACALALAGDFDGPGPDGGDARAGTDASRANDATSAPNDASFGEEDTSDAGDPPDDAGVLDAIVVDACSDGGCAPLATCAEIHAANPGAQSGLYEVDPD